MNYRITLFIALLSLTLTACENIGFEIGETRDNALTVKPAVGTRVDKGVQAKNGSLVYSIGSVFVGGGIADPSLGSSHRCHFYQEKFTTGPRWNEVEALVEIHGFRHNGVDYTKPGQYIDQILINGLDESLGLGNPLYIPMNQGRYEGGNDLIKDVRIQSYQFATYINQTGDQNKDSDIRITITSKAGDTITIRFVNEVTPYDGYY